MHGCDVGAEYKYHHHSRGRAWSGDMDCETGGIAQETVVIIALRHSTWILSTRYAHNVTMLVGVIIHVYCAHLLSVI